MTGRVAFVLVCRGVTAAALALALAFGAVYGSETRWVNPHADVTVVAP